MTTPGLRFIGTGVALPDKVLTNADIRRFNPAVDCDFVAERLGILERRVADPEMQTSDLAAADAREALAQAGVRPDSVDLMTDKLLAFEVRASDGSETVLEGRHERAVVARDRFLSRIERKACAGGMAT